MNIETRIKHIEERIKISAADFCACAGDAKYPRTEIIYYEIGKPATSPDLTDHTLPDVCSVCGRPIYKTAIIIDSEIPKHKEAE